MDVVLPLSKMTIEEKIQTMEAIWDDLCNIETSIPSPSWHKEILQERENKIKNDIEEFVDWNYAKKKIQNTIK